jgi:hypothetical protein
MLRRPAGRFFRHPPPAFHLQWPSAAYGGFTPFHPAPQFATMTRVDTAKPHCRNPEKRRRPLAALPMTGRPGMNPGLGLPQPERRPYAAVWKNHCAYGF